MGKWLNYGSESHDTPLIIRMGRFGPTEGAEWECRCGKVHKIVKIKGVLVWDHRVAAAVAELKAEGKLSDEDLAATGLDAHGLPVEVETSKPRLIPHPLPELATNLADLIVGRQGRVASAERIEDVAKLLRQLADWGYIAFPEPRSAGQA